MWLRAENQEFQWITDHDEVVDTHERREQFARLSRYLIIGLTKWNSPATNCFGTTGSPHAPEWSEDLAAIPDLVAGCYCELSSFLPSTLGVKLWNTRVNGAEIHDTRALTIATWMAECRQKLQTILLRLEQGSDGFAQASAQFFSHSQ